MISTALIDGFDCLSNGSTVKAFDFPTASISQAGLDLQAAGKTVPASELLDAPWSLTLLLSAASASALATAMTAMVLRFHQGAVLTIAEDGGLPCSSAIRTVQPPRKTLNGTWGLLSIMGDRVGAWDGKTVLIASAASPLPVNLFGTADLDSTPDGELDARAELFVSPAEATNNLALGMKHDPTVTGVATTEYHPCADYGAAGTSDATAVGGYRTTDATLSTDPTSPTALGNAGTTDSLDVNANRGEHLAFARVRSDDATALFYAQSKVTPEVGSAIAETEQGVTIGVANALKTLNLGRIRIPVQDVPDLSRGGNSGSYAAEVAQNENLTGASTATGHQTQTLTVTTTGLLAAVFVKMKETGGYAKVVLSRGGQQIGGVTYVAVPTSTAALTRVGIVNAPAVTVGDVVTVDIYPDGQTLTCNYNSSDAAYSGGARTGGGDLYFKTHIAPLITFGCTTPVLGSCAGSKHGSLDAVARIPLDDFAIVTNRVAAAGEGFRYNAAAGSIWLANATKTGATLAASAYKAGRYEGPAPGVVNRFVAAGDTGTVLPTHVYIWGSYVERWIDRQRAS